MVERKGGEKKQKSMKKRRRERKEVKKRTKGERNKKKNREVNGILKSSLIVLEARPRECFLRRMRNQLF